ncbi:MAG: glycoside hydrolase family 97 N-terminal domain-containing protein, partial [Bacteroidota bacterium]
MNLKNMLFILAFISLSCSSPNVDSFDVASPDESIHISFSLNSKGQPFYIVEFNNQKVIDTSYLGFEFIDKPPLGKDLEVTISSTSESNETWQMPWGEQLNVVNHYNELKIELKETTALNRKFNVIFRVYNDGLGFRYEFPEQQGWTEALIVDEHTEFNLTEDYKTFWTPGDW